MNPTLATLLTLAGILLLLRHDVRHGEGGSAARWLPVAWLGITGSRFLSQWLNLGAPHGAHFTEGSPLDAAYFASLMVMALVVLRRRGVRFATVAGANRWLLALALFGLVSVGWSDAPDVALRRWIKTLGHPLIALVILTDPDPVGALRAVCKRCAFILLPLSALFIKYLPEYGRSFDSWTGQPMNHGVGHSKNDLAMVAMTCGLFFTWNLLTVSRITDRRRRRIEVALSIAFIWMSIWQLGLSSGASALVSLVLGCSVLLLLGLRVVPKRHFVKWLCVAVALVVLLDSQFQLYERGIVMLGRNLTLTDRTNIWADVLALQQRPLLGYGFESFWLGDRLDAMWQKWWWRPTQAHNGYLETYLSLGIVGVALLAGLLISTLRRISDQLMTDFQFARLRLALLFAVLVFNWTEAGFKGVAFMWTIFHIVAMEYPRRADEPQLLARTA